jgi:hypothetical protein
MICSVGDLALEIYTRNNTPGAIVQRLDDGHWVDYREHGKPVLWPFTLEALPPGRYRVAESAD